MIRSVLFQVLLFTLTFNVTLADNLPTPAVDYQHFERKIRPLLSKHCYECHSSKAKPVHGGLRLDTDGGVKQGGDSGPAIKPGEPEESLLIEALRYKGDIQMPPEGKLSDAEIAEFVRWVRDGAPVPPSGEGTPETSAGIDFEAGRKFWSFQPAREHPLPPGSGWARTRIDAFVLAAMKRQGLSPPRSRVGPR